MIEFIAAGIGVLIGSWIRNKKRMDKPEFYISTLLSFYFISFGILAFKIPILIEYSFVGGVLLPVAFALIYQYLIKKSFLKRIHE